MTKVTIVNSRSKRSVVGYERPPSLKEGAIRN